MAEGGVAAALGHVAEADSWKVHFRDTMVGGKLLNNPRMAELHAKEAPDRVRELEYLGRRVRPDPRRPDPPATVRRAHAPAPRPCRRPDRARDDPDAPGPGGRGWASTVYMECTITRLITGAGRVTGAFGYWRTTGVPVAFPGEGRRPRDRAAPAGPTRSPRTRGSTAATARRWPTTAGAELIDMEFVQFHPTGMVWPPGVRGLLVTEAVRGEGGILRNARRRAVHVEVPARGPARRSTPRPTRRPARWVTALSQGRRDRRAAATRAVDPRQRRAGHLHRGPRGSGLAARRRLPRHQLPAAGPGPAQAAVDVRPVQGAGRRRHHDGSDGGRARRPTT